MESSSSTVADIVSPSFERLVASLYSAVLYNLGELQLRGVPDAPEDLMLARFNLGLLEVLREKCRGNLTDEEQRLIEGLIAQAREAVAKHAPVGTGDEASG